MSVTTFPKYKARCCTRGCITYTIVDRNTNESLPIVVDKLGQILRTITIPIASAVDPNHDWKLGGIGRGDDIEEEAIFATRGPRERAKCCTRSVLIACVAKGVGISDWRRWGQSRETGRLPSQTSRGSLRVSDAKVFLSAERSGKRNLLCLELTPSSDSVQMPSRSSPCTWHSQCPRPRSILERTGAHGFDDRCRLQSVRQQDYPQTWWRHL